MSGTSRWADVGGGDAARGRDYAARFHALAEQGADVHGEASLCAALVPVGARILDAGCGTGRVAIRLAELGYECVGVDSDPSMLDVARTTAPDLPWLLRDLADLAELPELSGRFDLVVAAGNVIPLLAAGSEPQVIAALADCLTPDGLLVAGFGLDAGHLPLPEAPFGLDDYDAWCSSTGLALVDRFGTWGGAPYEAAGGYAVTISRRLA